ncbi:transglutaminase-like cysteine peptidase [Aliiglaciecola sp. M165]|uniref:transglutaminase-like cysteine peptidase n=1 Tax=Aliiglaciecola sp. M165 TaxID=2593649 RepID=UPI00118053B6|nr:transglutaminase-like cysteine peptidase [Aliiglaciecola sp. M165]TRY33468.1 transglutaminase [Aliiglaciecola sp. M165]
MLICFDLLADIPFQISAKQYARIAEEYGDSAVDRVKSWQEIIAESSNLDEDEKLYEINRFFNQLAFVDDIEHWGKEDYWATPIEFLATDAGDCEDFTIAKYYSLRALGIPEEKMRLMYVKALRLNQAHMVLAYFSSPDAVPLILDNLNPRIMPAHRRTDLLPVYSFNGEGLWLAKAQGRGRQVQSGGNNSLWADLTERIEQGR